MLSLPKIVLSIIYNSDIVSYCLDFVSEPTSDQMSIYLTKMYNQWIFKTKLVQKSTPHCVCMSKNCSFCISKNCSWTSVWWSICNALHHNLKFFEYFHNAFFSIQCFKTLLLLTDGYPQLGLILKDKSTTHETPKPNLGCVPRYLICSRCQG